MVLYRGLVLLALSVLVALALLPATGSGSASPAPPGIPGLPPIPVVHLPKPDQKAVFDVVVEGKATDINHSQLSGVSSTCLVKEDGHVDETDTYLRGKDVKLEFARFGKTLVVKRNRGGQLGDTSLAVQVTVHRTATGGTSYSPAFDSSVQHRADRPVQGQGLRQDHPDRALCDGARMEARPGQSRRVAEHEAEGLLQRHVR